NERAVADAIMQRRHCPIVAAIGHESDTTIAELVADRRASTPTQAVTLLVPDREDLIEYESQLSRRLATVIARGLGAQRELLQRIARSTLLRSPITIVQLRREGVRPLGAALRHALASRLSGERSRVGELAHGLERARPATLASAAREGLTQR